MSTPDFGTQLVEHFDRKEKSILRGRSDVEVARESLAYAQEQLEMARRLVTKRQFSVEEAQAALERAIEAEKNPPPPPAPRLVCACGGLDGVCVTDSKGYLGGHD